MCMPLRRLCTPPKPPIKTPSSNLGDIQSQFTKQADFFETAWTHRYKKSNQEIMAWVMEQVGDVQPVGIGKSKALDVACGTGLMTRYLAGVCDSVVGLDATQAMLDEAKQACDLSNNPALEFFLGDAGKYANYLCYT